MKKLLSYPIFVGWDITYRCNLKCIHCFFGEEKAMVEEELSLDEIYDILDDLARNKVVSVQFAGGEPFIRSELLKIINHSSGLGLVTTLATNGLFCNEKVALELKESGIESIQISLDGFRVEHESIRGKNTFDATLKGLKAVIKQRIPVSVAVLINKRNCVNISEFIDYMAQLGVNAVRLQFLLLEGQARHHKNTLYVESDVINDTIQKALDNGYVKKGVIQLIFPCYYPSNAGVSLNGNNFSESSFLSNSCGAGTTSINIDPYGNVTACGVLTGKEWFWGSLKTQSLKDIWEKAAAAKPWRVKTIPKGCENCNRINSCLGGCRANAWLLDGNFYGKDPYCWRE